MPTTKEKKRNYVTQTGCAIVSDSVKDHSNDPFVLEMVEKAKIAVSKLVLPDHLKK